MKIAILYSEKLKEYDFGEGHPFRGERMLNFIDFFKKNVSLENFQIIEPVLATDDDLKLIHSQEYIDAIEKFYQAVNLGERLPLPNKITPFLSIDNIPGKNPGKLNLGARLIVGAAKMAGELVWQGQFKKVITFGGLHHATKNYGEGFCIFNDVAICAENLKRKFDAKKILILDTDAHAGNGTCEIFYQDPKILFIDLHQDPKTLYPGTGFAFEIGEGKGRGFTINIPLPPFAGNDSYNLVFEEIVFPIVEEFKPEIIIRNGGSDPHFADELTQLGLTLKGLKMIGQKIRELSKICDGKVVDFIGSGYNQKVLAQGWLALVSGLTGIDIELKEPVFIPERFKKDLVFEETKEVIKEIKKNLKDYWKCLR
jgi:acetoin utilization protein AcuC